MKLEWPDFFLCASAPLRENHCQRDMTTHILKLNCPDAVGLLARVTGISG